MMSLERLNALREFLLDKLGISLFLYKQSCKNWQKKDRNACQLKERVNQKPSERNRSFLNISG